MATNQSTSAGQTALREQLVALLKGGNSHAGFDAAVDDFPEHQRGVKPAGSPHTAWELLEHLRISQLDILEFSRDARHKSPKWPDEYWPKMQSPPNERAWDTSVANFRRDLDGFFALVSDPSKDLLVPLSHAPEGQSLLREALVLADHNSYHIGQIVLVRRILGEWES